MAHSHRSRGLLVAGLLASLAGSGCVTTVVTSGDEPGSLTRQAEAKRDVGMDHLSKGRTAMAIRELLASLEMNPNDHETHLWLGEAYRRKNMLDPAEEHVRRALDLKPDYQPTRLNLSGLYIQMERYEDAIVQARALHDDPTFPTPWRALTNQAFAEYRLGRIQEARTTLQIALDFKPDYWPALLNLGIFESEAGNRLEALEAFESVLAQRPGRVARAEVHYRMAEVFVALGHRERAIRHFSSTLDETPSGTWAQRSKRYLKLLR